MKVVVLSSLRSSPPPTAAIELGLGDADELVVLRQSGPPAVSKSRPDGSSRASSPVSPAASGPTGAPGSVTHRRFATKASPVGTAFSSVRSRARQAARAVSPGLSAMKFARQVLAEDRRPDLDGADLVVATDADTHLAAYLLARRLPPSCAVVVGISAGARVVGRVRSGGVPDPDLSGPAS